MRAFQGAVLRERLLPEEQRAFRHELTDAFESSVGSVVEYERDVHVGIARKA